MDWRQRFHLHRASGGRRGFGGHGPPYARCLEAADIRAYMSAFKRVL